MTCCGYWEPTLDGVRLADAGWVVTASDIPRAQARTCAVDVPGADGFADATLRVHGLPRLAPVEGTVELTHLCAEEADVERDLAWRWSKAGQIVRFEPWDRGGLAYECLWSPAVAERRHGSAVVSVGVTAQPAAFGARRSATVPRGGALPVGGTWPTAPTFRLTASGGQMSVSLAETGESVALASAPAQGSSVVLDMAAMSALVNGQAARVSLLSDWFRLPPSGATLSVSGGAGTVEWEERWL